MKHVQLVVKGDLNRVENRGCGECQASCQSACKTSCTVSNQECLNAGRNSGIREKR